MIADRYVITSYSIHYTKLYEASEARLNKAQELAVFGSFEQDLVSGEAHCSEGLLKLLGIPPGKGAPTTREFMSYNFV